MAVIACTAAVLIGYGIYYLFGSTIEKGWQQGIVKTDGQK